MTDRKENSMKRGTLYCVSVGPGDPELLTLKAVRIIRQCPAVGLSMDGKGEGRESCVAYRIASGAVPELKEKEALFLRIPMTKERAVLERSHREAAGAIIRFLEQGKDVAYLTLGDTSVYASCMYPAALVKEAGWQVEMVSGVPSFCAAAARLGLPLVSGSQQLHIIPSSYEIEESLSYPGVKVLMKAGSRMPQVKELLLAEGCQARAVERCGMEGERVYEGVGEIPEGAGYYTVVIAGGEKAGI